MFRVLLNRIMLFSFCRFRLVFVSLFICVSFHLVLITFSTLRNKKLQAVATNQITQSSLVVVVATFPTLR